MPDSVAAAAVEPLLAGNFGRTYIYRERCASTQLLLEPDAPEGAVAVCDEQTAGRGRLGRTWEAPRGAALLCSVLLRPPRGRRAPELSLVGGLAAAAAVEEALGHGAQVKWPNDVLVDGAKVAGVLAEARGDAVVLGVGLNVNQAADQLPEHAASLLVLDGRRRERAPLLASLLLALERRYEAWLADGLRPLHQELTWRDVLRGERVRVDGVAGTAAGIDEQGRLEVDFPDGRRPVESGDVRWER